MRETTKTLSDSHGSQAHIYLTEERSRRSWDYIANLKLTTALSEEDIAWKKVTVHDKPPHVEAPRQLTFAFDFKQVFRSLADRWSVETEHTSNLNKAINHPAYQQIIGMGKVAPTLIIPLILRELEERPDHWLAALHEISGADPVGPDDDFDEAIKAWREWGKQQYSR